MKKYIVENCPAHDYSLSDWDCLGTDTTECCECSDCLLKRIIKVCKEAPAIDSELSLRILELFKIHEVENDNTQM